MTYRYLPQPPKAWYRVENKCTFDTNNDNLYYDPFTKKYITLNEFYYRTALINKGNVLQYKSNSSNLTKKQRYTQIAKGLWVNRTRTWATQTETYTNPNTTSLKRVNYIEYPPDNLIPGQPNNPAGPFIFNNDNPYNCEKSIFKDGGNLLCSVYENPCTGYIVEKTFQNNYYPSTDSDVPGKITPLYWNPKIQTWYPRQRYTMNNSTNKWPINYKLFTSAATPYSPILSFLQISTNSITLNWTATPNVCVPITSFNIFQNNKLLINVTSNTFTFTINNLIIGVYQYYITAISNVYSSPFSNTVIITI